MKTLLRRALQHAKRVAVAIFRERTSRQNADINHNGATLAAPPSSLSYMSILEAAVETARELECELDAAAEAKGAQRAGEPKVALMASPGAEYVRGMFAIWLAGGVVVPLSLSQPEPELRYVLADANVEAILSTPEYRERTAAAAASSSGAGLNGRDDAREGEGDAGTDGSRQRIPIIQLGPVEEACGRADADATKVGESVDAAEARLHGSSGALIIYTSGTTGKPKGALHTFSSLEAQIESLCSAWCWHEDDRILHGLPLHHIHGIVNALLCPLHVGAAVEFLPRFSPSLVWDAWMRGDAEDGPKVNVFMGVPTMYVILLRVYDAATEGERAAMRAAASALRLTVSGSAACPVGVMTQWEELSGRRLLERYGMTEIGMALSNPYDPAAGRLPGCVGTPLPGVECKVRPEPRAEGAEGSGRGAEAGETGELLVRGPAVFREYVGKPRETAEAFDGDGWFRTGDTVHRDESSGVYRILGRSSVDIIKNGGYKLSALEIESVLLTHPDIKEVAVMGIDDEVYGEAVAALAALEDGASLSLEALRGWCKERVAPYKAPTKLRVIDEIPRNAMGKVNKKSLKSVFTEVEAQ